MEKTTKQSLDRTARSAGLLYLIVIVTGIFTLLYVPGRLDLAGGAESVARNIVANQSLYRLGVMSWLINQVAFALLPLALYRLFQAVRRDAAVVMVTLVLISVPVALIAASHRLDALSLVSSEQLLRALPIDSREAMVVQSLGAYRNAILVAQLFWGLWLLPLGYLVLKSGMVPKVLGILLVIGGFGYVVAETAELLYPAFGATVWSDLVNLPGTAGEFGLCFWLLVKGVRHAAPPSA